MPVIVIKIFKVHLNYFLNYCWFLYQERSEKNDTDFFFLATKIIKLLCFDCLTGVVSGFMGLIKTFFPSKNMKFKVYVLTFAQLLHDETVGYVMISVLQVFFFFLNHLKKSCLMFTQCLPNGEK